LQRIKTCALALYDPKRRLWESLSVLAEGLFNIMPDYSDRAESTEQSHKVAVVL